MQDNKSPREQIKMPITETTSADARRTVATNKTIIDGIKKEIKKAGPGGSGQSVGKKPTEETVFIDRIINTFNMT